MTGIESDGAIRVLDRTIAGGFLVLLAVTALTHGAVEPWSLALFQLIVIGLVALWGLKAVLERRLEIVVPPLAYPMLGLLALGLAQSVAWTDAAGLRAGLSLDVEATRQTVVVLGFMILAFLIAANFFTTRERWLQAANTLAIFGAILAAFALIQYFTWDGRFFWLRPTGGNGFGPFVNRAHFAGYMALILAMPLGLSLVSRRRETRVLYGFAAALMGTAVIASTSRGGTISVFLALGFMALMISRSGWPGLGRGMVAAPMGIAAAMLVGVLWVGAGPALGRFGDALDGFFDSGAPDVGRAEIWEGTARIVGEHPVMGAGLGAFATVYPTFSVEDMGLLVDYAHNDYLQILADGGILGGLIALWFLGLLVMSARAGMRSSDHLAAAVSLGAVTGIVAIAIHSLTDTHLQIPSNALLFLFMLAVVSNASRTNPPRRSFR